MPKSIFDKQGSAIIAASANLLDEAIQQCNRYFSRTENRPYEAGSAATKFQAEVTRNRGPRGGWTDDFARRLSERTGVYLLGSRNYLISMLTLVNGYPTGPGLAPIARCVAEASGKSAWLLDPRIGLISHARERVARLLLDELDDATRRKSLAVGLQVPDRANSGDAYRQAKDAIGKPEYFWITEIHRDSKGTLSVRNQTMPGLSQIVEIAEQIHSPQESSAKNTYRYLSALSHPTVFAYVESMVGRDPIFCGKLANYGALELHSQMRIHSGWTQACPEHFPEGASIMVKHLELDDLLRSLEDDSG